MPSRLKLTLTDIVQRDNLAKAAFLAARGKRSRFGVQRYLRDLDANLNELSEAVLEDGYIPQPLREFVIRDPKHRIIHAPGFRDRVLHHAIILQAGPQIDRTLIDDSFACRLNKGSIAAVMRAQHFSRRSDWFLKVDVAKYFHSINHELLFERLRRRFKGMEFLNLLDRIIAGFHSAPGKGLAIGALTSQYFANLYLNDADRWLIARNDVRGYVRYMDDMLCWFDSKAAALRTLSELGEFLRDHLALKLKANSQVNRTERGLSFCGHRIFPAIIRLTKRRQRLYRSACIRWERRFLEGEIDAFALQCGYASAFSITKHADALEWRRSRMHQHLIDDI